MASSLADLLAALSSAFSDLGVRWYLFGAQAAIVHGAARLTADVDVTVDFSERPTRELVQGLARHGFALRRGMPLQAAHPDADEVCPSLRYNDEWRFHVLIA